MPGRKFNGGDYRYGFNGMENDNEIKGDGNSIDFGARMYDSRLGRWFAVDPQAAKYPGWTPYKFGLDNPINYIDPDGETEWHVNTYVNKEGKVTKIEVVRASENLRAVLNANIKMSFTPQRYNYHDYVVHRTIRHTGNFGIFPLHTTTVTKTRTLVDNAPKEKTWSLFDLRGDIKSPSFTMKGGFNLVGSSGGASPTKYTIRDPSINVETINVDLIISALGGISGGPPNVFKGELKMYETIGEFSKSATKISEVVTAVDSKDEEAPSVEPDTLKCSQCSGYVLGENGKALEGRKHATPKNKDVPLEK